LTGEEVLLEVALNILRIKSYVKFNWTWEI